MSQRTQSPRGAISDGRGANPTDEAGVLLDARGAAREAYYYYYSSLVAGLRELRAPERREPREKRRVRVRGATKRLLRPHEAHRPRGRARGAAKPCAPARPLAAARLSPRGAAGAFLVCGLLLDLLERLEDALLLVGELARDDHFEVDVLVPLAALSWHASPRHHAPVARLRAGRHVERDVPLERRDDDLGVQEGEGGRERHAEGVRRRAV